MLSDKAQKFLLELSRHAIEYFFETKEILSLDKVKIASDIREELTEKMSAFVILMHKDHAKKTSIRGINGLFEAVDSIGKLIIQLSVNAAFFDPNVPRLKPYELNEVRVHLVFPKLINKMVAEESEIASYVQSQNCGVILDNRGRRAYVLPSQRKEIEDYATLIRTLKLQIGIKKNSKYLPDVLTFEVDEVSEV